MDLIHEFSTTTLLETSPGELVKIDSDYGACFGVVLAIDTKPPMVGFLQPTGKASIPVYRRIANRKCISFGKKWAIEAILDETTLPGNNTYQSVSGALFIAGKNAIVCFQPDKESYNSIEVYFNLTTSQFEDSYPRDLAAPLLSWNIWESKASFAQPGYNPLIKIIVS